MKSIFIKKIKTYKLTSLLETISEVSRKILIDNGAILEVPFVKYYGKFKKSIKLIVAPWNLNEIAFLAIKNTNDFARFEIDLIEFWDLYNEYMLYDEEKTKNFIGENPKRDILMNYLFGLSEKTFWFQEMSKNKARFNREYELLQIIPNIIGCEDNYDEIIFKRTGFKIEVFRLIIFTIFAVIMRKTNITYLTEDGSLQVLNENLTISNVKKIIDYYSSDYNGYRTSKLYEKFFYIKPIVKVLNGNYIAVSPFNFGRKISEGVFWELRNHYLERKDQSFINKFGEYFEEYIKRLLTYYLENKCFNKIPLDDNRKSADWLIKTTNFILVIEQKSSISPITLKDQYNINESLIDYLDKFKEAIFQCETSEKKYKDNRICIKFILLYDELDMCENILKEKIFSGIDDKINKNYYIVLNVLEFEYLIKVLSKNEEIFNDIINYKIYEAYKVPGEGLDIGQIIKKFYSEPNDYAFKILPYFDELANIRKA